MSINWLSVKRGQEVTWDKKTLKVKKVERLSKGRRRISLQGPKRKDIMWRITVNEEGKITL